jgi:hypothetical protein
MNITFKTEQFDLVTTTEYDNLPDSHTWYELTDLFWNHLESSGYTIDSEARETMFDALDDLMCDRYSDMLTGKYE